MITAKSLEKKVCNSDDSMEAGKSYGRLFEKASRSDLIKLSGSKHTSVALQSYWELHRVTVPRKGDWFGGTPFFIDKKSTQRFIGFLEGRTRLSVPDWWERDFPDVDHSKQYDPEDKNKEHIEDLDLRVPRGISLKRKNDIVIVSYGGKTAVIPFSVFERYGTGTYLNAVIRGDRVFVVFYSGAGYKSPLLCIDSKSQRVLWQADVWAIGTDNIGGTSGPWWHEIEIVTNDKYVAVFGMGSGAYAEGFHVADGTCAFRFTRNYWFAWMRPEKKSNTPSQQER